MKDNKPFIVACICKNEMLYIYDFVKYHLELGFDKIVIGDNNDIDGENYCDILHEFLQNGTCEIIDLRGRVAYQKQFYNDIINENNFAWCAFIDCDEYITFGEKFKCKSIKEFLKSDKNAHAYKLNWMCYGDNDLVHYEDKPVTERFKTPMPYNFKFHYPFSDNFHVKSIIRGGTKARYEVNPHVAVNVGYKTVDGKSTDSSPFNKDLDYSKLYIRHFYTKTLEEWVDKKMKNKYADCAPSNNVVYYPLKDFFIYNKITPEKKEFLKERGITL